MQIKITTANQILRAEAGSNLYRVLAAAGLLDAPCGGQGRCGKCRVRFNIAPPKPLPYEITQLSEAELAAGWRLACLRQLQSDLNLETPKQGRATVEGAFWGGADDFTSDSQQGYGLAVDIGATTLAVCLVDLNNGAQLAAAACLNSQKSFGQDVISRINYAATKPNGTLQQQTAVINDLKALLQEVCEAGGIEAEEITLVSVAANPTMAHLAANINPAPLGRAPYTLVCKGPLNMRAQTWGLPLAPDANINCLPAVTAFLGGDIVGGMLAAALDEPGPTRLFIDIGTNGEIVLARAGDFFACSTAAGPALEGMNIQCGMRAALGAVDQVSIEGESVHYTTIGGGAPRGLAGSGLLAAVSALRLSGLLDRSGRLQLKCPVGERHGRRCLIIDEATDLVLTQDDIRQTQLAKGAIRSGLEALLAATGCPPNAVNQVLVAGGFGARLSEPSLIETGLLPREFAGKIRYLGNAALAGARLCLLKAATRARAECLASKITYIELAKLADYQQRFIDAMHFE